MKLLMISGDRSILARKKGAFWYTLEEFRKHWGRVDVVCPAASSGDWRLEIGDWERKNVFFHPSPHGLWYQPRWIVKKGTELIAAHHHDVMTVHEYPPFYNGMGARKLSEKTGVPYVLEVHHVVGWPRPASMVERMGLTMSRQYLPQATRRAAATRVVNAGTRELLVSFGAPAEKIHIVPSFYLDASLLKPDPAAKRKYDIAFCARLVANKGLHQVTEAIKDLPGVTMLVIGDGPERAKAEGMIKHWNMTGRVTFAGWLPTREDVVAALHASKIFIMNSTSEGGPRSALEAMACGLPVISTKVGVMPDVIEEGVNGMFTTGKAEDLQGKIRGLLGDQALRERMGKAAAKIGGRFERGKLVREYAEFLKEAGKARKA